MSLWTRFWFGGVAAARPLLFVKGLLVLLSFDCWLNLVPHGARYGVGGFNVAHFLWLDRLQPMPTPTIYLSVVMLSGVIAFAMVVGRLSRAGLIVLTLLYTYGWMMSMLDSYQHHYLLSLLLFCACFLQPITSAQLFRRENRILRISAWPFVLAGMTIAIVYAFTAITKMAPDWQNGAALQRLLEPDRIDILRSWLATRGVSTPRMWRGLSISAIVLQLLIAVGYWAALGQDRPLATPLRRLSGLLVVAPLAFHITTEWLNLEIEWFSYYMIWFALVVFAPERWINAATRLLTAPARYIADIVNRQFGSKSESQATILTLTIGVVGAAVSFVVGSTLDLPGAQLVGGIVALAVLLLALRAWLGGAPWLRGWIAGGAVAMVVFGASVLMSNTRYDYYRFGAGDYRRRGDYAKALEMYEKANKHAPPGENRKAREEEMRRRLK